jgi:hypothetical protein
MDSNPDLDGGSPAEENENADSRQALPLSRTRDTEVAATRIGRIRRPILDDLERADLVRVRFGFAGGPFSFDKSQICDSTILLSLLKHLVRYLLKLLLLSKLKKLELL